MSDATLVYEGYQPAEEGLREALTSTGNGYFCARGTAEWEDADGEHYPGTDCHGGYNRETTVMGGRAVLNEDLVNLPNWLVLKLRIEGDDVIRPAGVDILEYRHVDDIRTATVMRSVRFRDRAGRETSLLSRRFVRSRGSSGSPRGRRRSCGSARRPTCRWCGRPRCSTTWRTPAV